jgi:hypothetical protein
MGAMITQMKNRITQITSSQILPALVLLLCFVCISALAAEDKENSSFANFNAALWYQGLSPEQEITSARTLNTKVFSGPNGNRIYRIFSHPVHYVAEHGKLEDLSDSCVICENWQVGESYGGYVDGLFEEKNVCGQTATYIEVNEVYFLRGFVEFNTDAVPDTALVDSLKLSLNCVQWPVFSEDHDIWSMESQPSMTSVMGVYYDAMDGDCYVDDYLGGTGWNSWELDSIAIETFVNQLDDDWFAVGISDFTSASAYYLLYQCGSGYMDVVELGIAEEKPAQPATRLSLDVEPNPFTSATTIRLTAPRMGHGAEGMGLHIYDIIGREVRRLEFAPRHSQLGTAVTWDGRDERGNRVPSGTYFCKAMIADNMITKKMTLIQKGK